MAQLKWLHTETPEGQPVKKWNQYYYVQMVAGNYLNEAANTACEMNHMLVLNKIEKVMQLNGLNGYEQKRCELLLWLTNQVMKKVK